MNEWEDSVFSCSYLADLPLNSSGLREEEWSLSAHLPPPPNLSNMPNLTDTSLETDEDGDSTNDSTMNEWDLDPLHPPVKEKVNKSEDVSMSKGSVPPGGSESVAQRLKNKLLQNKLEKRRVSPSASCSGVGSPCKRPHSRSMSTDSGDEITQENTVDEEEKKDEYVLVKNRKKSKKRKTTLVQNIPAQSETAGTEVPVVDATKEKIPTSEENPPPKKQKQNPRTLTSTRKTLFPETSNPPPVFLEYPVICEDLKKGPATLHGLGLNRLKTFTLAVGPILSVRKLPGGSVLVGCVSHAQQKKLLSLTEIGSIEIKTFTPEVTTEGVIKRVPLFHSDEDLKEMTITVRIRTDGGGLVEKGETAVRQIRRLKTKEGKASEAVRITFRAAVLPESVVLEGEVYGVEAFACPVRRCTFCQKLGHLKFHCRAKKPTCGRCSSYGHDGNGCDKERSCVNCKEGHSSSYQGCKEYRLRMRANKIRSATYIPYSEAMHRARIEVTQEKEKLNKHTTETGPAERRDEFWRAQPARLTSTPEPGYAKAAGRGRDAVRDAANIPPTSTIKKHPVPALRKKQLDKQKHNPPPEELDLNEGQTEPKTINPDEMINEIFSKVMSKVQEGMIESTKAAQREAEKELAEIVLIKIQTKKVTPSTEQTPLLDFVEHALVGMVEARQKQSPGALIDTLVGMFNTITNTSLGPISPSDTMLALGSLAGSKDLTAKEIHQLKLTL